MIIIDNYITFMASCPDFTERGPDNTFDENCVISIEDGGYYSCNPNKCEAK